MDTQEWLLGLETSGGEFHPLLVFGGRVLAERYRDKSLSNEATKQALGLLQGRYVIRAITRVNDDFPSS